MDFRFVSVYYLCPYLGETSFWGWKTGAIYNTKGHLYVEM